jgi:diketogulonate reductase-like aldo/keto reductase
VTRIGQRYGRSAAQIVFRFALEVGMIALTGTTDTEHMRNDLAVSDIRLEPEDVSCIETLAAA